MTLLHVWIQSPQVSDAPEIVFEMLKSWKGQHGNVKHNSSENLPVIVSYALHCLSGGVKYAYLCCYIPGTDFMQRLEQPRMQVVEGCRN